MFGGASGWLYFVPGLVELLISRRLELSPQAAAALLHTAMQPDAFHQLSHAKLLKQLERFEQPLEPELQQAAEQYRAAAEKRLAPKEYQKLAKRLALPVRQ